MPGTRGAGTINGTPTLKQITIKTIDNSSDKRSDALRVPVTVTNAEIETFVAAYQAASNASVYEVQVKDVYTSIEDDDNAVNSPRESESQLVSAFFKDENLDTARAVLRAPLDAMFLNGTDQVDPSNAAFGAWLAALTNLINGGAGGSGTKEIIHVRFTDRRESNHVTPI